MEKSKPDYLALHTELWMKISRQVRRGVYNKRKIYRDIIERENLTPYWNSCFLCDDTRAKAGSKDCNKCKGKWAFDKYDYKYCCNDLSFYDLFLSAFDHNDFKLASALAEKIATSFK